MTHYRICILLSTFVVIACALLSCDANKGAIAAMEEEDTDTTVVFTAPDTSAIPRNAFGELVRYGRQLILNTAYYIGPEGKAGNYLGNKMNCTNCHLDGGTRPFGINYFSTHARYPQFGPRENRIVSLAERINNCIERPHNGKAMPVNSREMLAITCYIRWLGEGVPVGKRVHGDRGLPVKFPGFALDVKHGQQVFMNACARCHGQNGEGKLLDNGATYEYPPLWGEWSFQEGASMFRIIKAAQFIKANMPHDKASWQQPFLSDRDAFDVAAFIDSEERGRPKKPSSDYPDIRLKPIDYPFGPYDDTFSERQHKYGPYQPIIDYRRKKGLYVEFN